MSLSDSILVGDSRPYSPSLLDHRDEFKDLTSTSVNNKNAASSSNPHIQWFEEENLDQEWIPETVKSKSDTDVTCKPLPTLEMVFNHNQHSKQPKRRTKQYQHTSISRSNSQLEIANSGLFESSKAPSLPDLSSTEIVESLSTNIPNDNNNQDLSLDATDITSNPSNTDINVPDSPAAAGTVNVHSAIYTSSPNTGTVIEGRSSAGAGISSVIIHSNNNNTTSTQNAGTTRYYENGVAGSVIQSPLKANKPNIQTPQWKRAYLKAQKNEVAYEHDENKEHSFQRLFNPPTMDMRDLAQNNDAHDQFDVDEYLSNGGQKESNDDKSIELSQDENISNTDKPSEHHDDNFDQSQFVYHMKQRINASNYSRALHQPLGRYLSRNDSKRFSSPQSQHTSGSSSTTTTGISLVSATTRTSAVTQRSDLFGDQLQHGRFSRAISATTANTDTSQTSKSPLKLFSIHDTYTNNRLDNLLDAMVDEEEFEDNESAAGHRAREEIYANNVHTEPLEAPTMHPEERSQSYITSHSPSDNQIYSDSQNDYSSSNIPDENGFYNSTEEFDDYHYPENNASSLNTDNWNSADRHDFKTEDFMNEAENLMNKLRDFYVSSTNSNHEYRQGNSNDEFEHGEYTTIEESSMTSDAEHIDTRPDYLKTINVSGNYSSDLEESDIIQTSGSQMNGSSPGDVKDRHHFLRQEPEVAISAAAVPGRYYHPSLMHPQKSYDDDHLIPTLKPSANGNLKFLKQGAIIYEDSPNNRQRPVSSGSSNTNQTSSTIMSASQSPDKPGRRNMGVILGTDDVAKNIPKTMGAMQFDSKNKVWYKVDAHGRHIRHSRHSQGNHSNDSYSSSQRLQERSNNQYHSPSHLNYSDITSTARAPWQRNNAQDTLPNIVEADASMIDVSIRSSLNILSTHTNVNHTAATSVTNVSSSRSNSFTSDEIDVFSGIDDLESSGGTNNRSRANRNGTSNEGTKNSVSTIGSDSRYNDPDTTDVYEHSRGVFRQSRFNSDNSFNDHVEAPLGYGHNNRNQQAHGPIDGHDKLVKAKRSGSKQSSLVASSKIPVSSRRPLPKTPMEYPGSAFVTSTPQSKIPRTHKPNPNHLLPATPKAQFTREARRHFATSVLHPSSPSKSGSRQTSSRSRSRSPRKNRNISNVANSKLLRIQVTSPKGFSQSLHPPDTRPEPSSSSSGTPFTATFSVDYEQPAKLARNGRKLVEIFDKTMFRSTETPSSSVLGQLPVYATQNQQNYETPVRQTGNQGMDKDKENLHGKKHISMNPKLFEKQGSRGLANVPNGFHRNFNRNGGPDNEISPSHGVYKKRPEVSFDVNPRIISNHYIYEGDVSTEADASLLQNSGEEDQTDSEYESEVQEYQQTPTRNRVRNGTKYSNVNPISRSFKTLGNVGPSHDQHASSTHSKPEILLDSCSTVSIGACDHPTAKWESLLEFNEDDPSHNATQISLLSDLSYQHSKSRLVHVLTDRYAGNLLSSSKILSDDLYQDTNSDDDNQRSGRRDSNAADGIPDMFDISMRMSNNIDRGIRLNNGVLCWDTLTDINLSHSGLESLIDLDTLCPKLVRLDASHNKLHVILGIPASIRVLDISYNALANMTTVGGFKNLTNLHFLDMSFNSEVTSLVGISHLINLRELRVRDCSIESLSIAECDRSCNVLNASNHSMSVSEYSRSSTNGHKKSKRTGLGFAKDLDALAVVDLRNNRLSGALDFKHDCEFSSESRLESINLSGNKIREIWNLYIFGRLKSLDLGMFFFVFFFWL